MNTKDLETVEFEIPLGLAEPETPQPFSSLIHIDFGAMSHAGKVRPNNQDSYVIYQTGRSWERLMTNLSGKDLPERFDEKGFAMVLADGMGGAAAGQVASSLAVRVGVNLVLQAPKWALKLDRPETRDREIEEAKQRAEKYFQKIDQTLLEYSNRFPSLKGMGTTLTATYIYATDLFLLHTGDSRAYLFRGGKLWQLTHDQTVAQALADSGAITPEEVSTHRFRHMLTSCLGANESRLNIEINQYSLLDGDQILLCTDGLTNEITNDVIARTLNSGQSATDICQTLVQLAMENGGRDNITVLLARYTSPLRSE